MGRIISVEIIFQNTFYTVLVSMVELQDGPYFHIQLFDEALITVLKDNHIRYKGLNGYKNVKNGEDIVALEVLERISLAMQKEMQKNKVA